MNPILVLPSEQYKESFLEAVAEQEPSGPNRLEGEQYEKFNNDFETWLAYNKDEREGRNLPEGWVQQTVYWLVEGDKFIGRVSIRHVLNDHLMIMGGHIGYTIRPSERHKGYGNLALKLALPKAREIGIESALLTCNKENIASRKIIEKNGGVFENEKIGADGHTKLRFWVPTS